MTMVSCKIMTLFFIIINSHIWVSPPSCVWPRCSRCYLVQGAHGEHGAVVGFDGLDERCVSPDVNVSIGGSGEDEVLRSTVTRRHHRLLLPQVPENPPFKCQTATCGRRSQKRKQTTEKQQKASYYLSHLVPLQQRDIIKPQPCFSSSSAVCCNSWF